MGGQCVRVCVRGWVFLGRVQNSQALMTDRPAADELAVNALITPTKAKWSRTAPSLS